MTKNSLSSITYFQFILCFIFSVCREEGFTSRVGRSLIDTHERGTAVDWYFSHVTMPPISEWLPQHPLVTDSLTSVAADLKLGNELFELSQTLFKSYRYKPTMYKTAIKRRIEWYNQINEIPIIKRKFFLSKIFCLEKIYFRFIFKSIFKPNLMKNVSMKIFAQAFIWA